MPLMMVVQRAWRDHPYITTIDFSFKLKLNTKTLIYLTGMNPVSTSPLMNAGWVDSRLRKSIFVVNPTICVLVRMIRNDYSRVEKGCYIPCILQARDRVSSAQPFCPYPTQQAWLSSDRKRYSLHLPGELRSPPAQSDWEWELSNAPTCQCQVRIP